MLHWALSVATGAAILSSGSATPPHCFIGGIYVLDLGRSEDVQQAITSAVAGLPNTDHLSRRLRKANTPGTGVRISNSEGRFSIKYDTRPQILVSTNGEPVQWKLNDGQVFDVSATANGEAVSLTLRSTDGQRTTVYRIVGPQFVEETTIISPRLSKPIRYRLVYNQAKC